MWQLLKRTWWVWLLAGGLQSAAAFSMLGQWDDWQVESLDYITVDGLTLEEGVLDSAIGGPMNLGEEFRWNIPTLNYAFDQNFLDYFGSNGVFAVDQAMAILNGLSNVTSYSADLSEVPLEATRINYRARALGLLDLKSATLHVMAEQLGLANPVRFTWTLRQRVAAPSCPFYLYMVIKRNFNPITWEPSSYVNETLYTYTIIELCPAVDRADAVEYKVDPLQPYYTAVASAGLFDGSYFTGFTRDDVGGLRYLLRTNNVNMEDAPQGTTLISGGFTNTAARQLLSTSNLTTLVYQSQTNGPFALQALFPGLIVASTTTTFTNVVTTNVTAYFTNFPYSPVGSPASLVLLTNFSTNVQLRFLQTFANVVTNTYSTSGLAIIRDTTVKPSPNAPVGSGILVTNVSETTVIAPFVNGGYFLVPPDLCGYSIVSTQLVTVFPITNNVFVSTIGGATNANGLSFSRDVITFFTNYIFVVDPIVCGTNGPAFHQGINKINYVRRSYDSLLGQYFEPVTNRFQLTMVTNSMAIVQTFERIVTQPDILFSADDLAQPPTGPGFGVSYVARSIIYNTNNILPGLPGPGLIEPSTIIVFDKIGPAFENDGPFFMSEEDNVAFFVWGSFDGSTNAPVIYPSGTSIMDYENQVLMQVTTASLPGGVAVPPTLYPPQQLQGSGGQPPYSWSLAPGSASLPPGLTLSAAGIISGTPTTRGVYGFTVRLTDSAARSVTRALSITIGP